MLLVFHNQFHWERDLEQIPALYLAGGLVFAGIIFLPLYPLIVKSNNLSKRTVFYLLGFIVLFGLIARIALVSTTPALEDDYYRYLWDGAVTANGINPYSHPPQIAGQDGGAQHNAVAGRLADLAKQAGAVHERINHASLKTVYPPLAQGAFALAYVIKPWSLTAWRIVCLLGEVATLGLLLALLHACGRSPLWSALYWWNPLVIKEMINSAHMEAVLMPFVLAGLLAAIHKRHLLAATMIGLAAGIKLWPIILAPLVLRPLMEKPRQLLVALAILFVLSVIWIIPPVLGGLDESSGFVAYATQWKTNSALSAALGHLNHFILQPLGMSSETANRLLRLSLVLVLVGIIIWQTRPMLKGADDLITRASVILIALLLLSPAQFPWYLVWVMPLMTLRPVAAMLLASALLPIYYSSFYFYAEGNYFVFKDQIVWAIWLPIWLLLIYDSELRNLIEKPRRP